MSEPNNEEVICPHCAHQFRAIPVQVQGLLTAAGYEPPYLAAPTPQGVALTDEQIARHTLTAKDCPPDSRVLLVSSVKRLQERAALPTSGEPAETQAALDVPADVLKYARAFIADGYRGPYAWAKRVFDWVAAAGEKKE
jgi:hypothetical protein